ncbi:hypothetical protein ONZ45_g14224 [Pleurotus djamor]|nr:hypothetical protein ONZ45_g14224 [Pleurotus djamor]
MNVRSARPAKKLKPFFWNKLANPAVSSSFWIEKPVDISFKMDDLEDTFTLENAPSTPSKVTSPSSKKNITTLLDITRANNVDELKAISRQLPTQDEMNRIRDFDDVSKLAKSDQYFSQIMTIPRLAERLECMLYRRKLDVELDELCCELQEIRSVANDVRSSSKLKHILQAVLTVGNALNGSTFRGNAKGFQLDTLTKTKIYDPSMWPQDTMMQTQSSLISGLGQVKSEISQLKGVRTSLEGDRFVFVMQPFVDETSPKIDKLRLMGDSVNNQIKSLLAYYGESSDSAEALKPEDFFGLISAFYSSLQKCATEVLASDDHLQQQLAKSQPTIQEPEPQAEKASIQFHNRRIISQPLMKYTQTVKELLNDSTTSSSYLQPSAQQKSIGRGDFDNALKSMRTGRRRERPTRDRPLSKIFLDGGRPQSRYFADS